jgi:hypothetical protein
MTAQEHYVDQNGWVYYNSREDPVTGHGFARLVVWPDGTN